MHPERPKILGERWLIGTQSIANAVVATLLNTRLAKRAQAPTLVTSTQTTGLIFVSATCVRLEAFATSAVLQELHATPAASWHPTALGFWTLPVVGSWWALSISSLGVQSPKDQKSQALEDASSLLNSQRLKVTAI